MAVDSPAGEECPQGFPPQIQVDGVTLDTIQVIDAARRCVWSMQVIGQVHYGQKTHTQALKDIHAILKGNRRFA